MTRPVGTWVGAAALIFVMLGAATAEPRRVLMLHSFGRNFAPFSDFAGQFREELVQRSPEPIDLYEASLETARYSDPQDETPLIEYLRALFAERKLDLIVTTGGPAARFVQRYRERLFSSTPAIITAVEQRNINAAALTTNDTVVAFTIDFATIIDNILQVLPETTNVAVVLGSSPFEKFWVAEMTRAYERFTGRINFIWLNEFSAGDMLTRAAALPPGSAIFYTLFAVDADGVPHEQNTVLTQLHREANAPLFSFVDTYLGRGIVGGPLLSHQTLSARAIEVATRILRGETPGNIKTAPMGFETPAFDRRELRRWNITEARLPEGSIVKFREPTAWERYRWQLIAILSVLLVQGAIITWLLFERRRRHAAELESRGRMLEVIHLNGTAAAGALSASIAHELNQPLGAIQSYAEAAEQYLKINPPNLKRALDILVNIRRDDQRAAEIIARLRDLLKKRSEIVLQEFELNDAIRDAIEILDAETLKRGATLVARLSEQSLAVRADKVHLQQVLLNLALNGLDAMQNCDRSVGALTI
jgi:signal transduction histidine kinase